MATLQQQLEEAKSAYHDLMIGKSAASFRDSNGEMVTYTQANRAFLRTYINELQASIDTLAGAQPRGPLRVIF